MEYISAPWREEYVKRVFRMPGCIFCRAPKLRNDRDALILFRGKHNFIILNKFPYTPGHIMIAPYRHLGTFDRATKGEGHELAELLTMSLRILKRHYHPQGFNAGLNLGRCAGAGVIHHYHLHVIPRWQGDSNFMPLISQTRILIEDLESTFEHLLPLFEKEKRKRKKIR